MKKLVPKNAVLIPENAERVFKGQIFDVYHWPQEMFDGSMATFEMLRRPDTTIVIGVADDKVLVIDDEQPHTGSRLGFPGGRVDTNEDTLTSAKREILEETGYEFNGWRLIKVVQPHSKIEWFIYFYLAWDGRKNAEPHLDAGEKIDVRMVPFTELKRMIFNKAGYLGNAIEIFEDVNSLGELKQLPEFSGQEI